MLTVGSNGGGNQATFTKGVYVKAAKVVSVTPYYNQPKFQGGLYPDDIGLEIVFDIGQNFQPRIRIGGKFHKTKDELTGIETITGWGSAFVVNDFFSRLGVQGDLRPDNTIPDEWCAQVVGKELLKLDYVRGVKKKDPSKKAYSTWDQFGTVATGEAELVKRFLKAVEKNFVKDFRPDTQPMPAAASSDPF